MRPTAETYWEFNIWTRHRIEEPGVDAAGEPYTSVEVWSAPDLPINLQAIPTDLTADNLFISPTNQGESALLIPPARDPELTAQFAHTWLFASPNLKLTPSLQEVLRSTCRNATTFYQGERKLFSYHQVRGDSFTPNACYQVNWHHLLPELQFFLPRYTHTPLSFHKAIVDAPSDTIGRRGQSVVVVKVFPDSDRQLWLLADAASLIFNYSKPIILMGPPDYVADAANYIYNQMGPQPEPLAIRWTK